MDAAAQSKRGSNLPHRTDESERARLQKYIAQETAAIEAAIGEHLAAYAELQAGCERLCQSGSSVRGASIKATASCAKSSPCTRSSPAAPTRG